MVPPGSKIFIHEKLKQWGSWDPHDEDGGDIGPAIDHYQCYHYYCISTATPRYADTVEFFSTAVQMPHPSSIEIATQAALDLSVELQNPSSPTPFARYGDIQLRALRLLQNIFQQTLPPTLFKHKQPLDKPIQTFKLFSNKGPQFLLNNTFKLYVIKNRKNFNMFPFHRFKLLLLHLFLSYHKTSTTIYQRTQSQTKLYHSLPTTI